MQSKSILAITAAIFFIVGCQKENPTSSFKTEQDVYYIKQSVQFQNQSENALNYYWNFGDGSSSTLKNPGHTYNESGEYIVTLQVQGAKKTIDAEFSKQINILDAGENNNQLNLIFANTSWKAERTAIEYYNCSSEDTENIDENPDMVYHFNDDNTVTMLTGSYGNICDYEVLSESKVGFFEDPYYRLWSYVLEGDNLTLTFETLSPCFADEEVLGGYIQTYEFVKI